jgi:hypothetical protein
MKTHLDDDVLLDVMEGRAEAEAAGHARGCAECAARLAEAGEGLALAASADVPAPSPLFWTAMRSRIAAGLTAPPRRARAALFAPALFAAAAMIAAALYLPATSPLAPRPTPIARSSPELEAVTVADAPLSVEELAECRDVEECVVSLSDEESRAVAETLRAALARNGDL